MSETTTKSKKDVDQDRPRTMDEILGPSVEQERQGRGVAALGETRRMLKAQLSKSVRAVAMGANLFQKAVRRMSEEEQEKKLEIDVAERVKDALVDKVAERFKEAVVEVSDIGKAVAEKSATVFGTIKSSISERIKAQSELSVLQAADAVTAAMIEKSLVLEEHLSQVIDALPAEKVLAVRDVLAQFNGIKDDADTAETGKLEDGMKEWAMTDLIGLPAGDGVAIEEYGRDAFASFQEAVRSTMTVHEQGAAIQHRLAHPNEDQQKIEEAEKDMGPHFKSGIARDKGMRQRVAATGDQ